MSRPTCPLLLPESGADVRTQWFPVGRMRARRAGIAMAILGGLGGLVVVTFAGAALAGGAGAGGAGAGVRAGMAAVALSVAVLVLLGLRRMWQVAGDRRARLGVGPQGVWWCEQQVAFLFPWQGLSATALLGLRWRTAKGSYVNEYLELFPVVAAQPVHPVLDRLVVGGHYRLALPDARLLGGLVPLTETIARPLGPVLAHAAPGHWRGRHTRDATETDRKR